VAIGGRVRFDFTLRSRARTPQELLVDVALHFVKARGDTAAKVFKVKRVTLPPGGQVPLGVTFSLAVHTTRVPRPGAVAISTVPPRAACCSRARPSRRSPKMPWRACAGRV
jgi:hypothetical protein